MIGLPIIWRLRTLAFVALALAVFGAIECPPLLANFDRLRFSAQSMNTGTRPTILQLVDSHNGRSVVVKAMPRRTLFAFSFRMNGGCVRPTGMGAAGMGGGHG